MATILSPAFFDRSAEVVARELLGCYLCVRVRDQIERHMITETEAYIGPEDLASHASRGRTARTEVMFASAGTIYIYLIYGMYDMLNIVTDRKDHPAAVLIRGVGPWNGPGKLTKALGITRRLNAQKLGKATGLWVEGATQSVTPNQVKCAPRIGVAYAKEWAEKELRFILVSPTSLQE